MWHKEKPYSYSLSSLLPCLCAFVFSHPTSLPYSTVPTSHSLRCSYDEMPSTPLPGGRKRKGDRETGLVRTQAPETDSHKAWVGGLHEASGKVLSLRASSQRLEKLRSVCPKTEGMLPPQRGLWRKNKRGEKTGQRECSCLVAQRTTHSKNDASKMFEVVNSMFPKASENLWQCTKVKKTLVG